ncbi:hypothetical protein PR048_017602, partial [Dryococelus australis]
MRIEWKFSPPLVAWWGGFWERVVVQMVKLLRCVLGRAVLTYEKMMTVLAKCESVVNSRSMFYISEICEGLVPLTPSITLVSFCSIRYRNKILCQELKIDDVVIIGSDDKRRIDWPLAKIITASPRRDEVIGVVRVKTSSGKFVRPVKHVYPMAVKPDCVQDECPGLPEERGPVVSPSVPKGCATRSGRRVKISSHL